jgi:hypothetical protein
MLIPKVVAVVGLSKNAGKTSYINWLLRDDNFTRLYPDTHSSYNFGLTTTGRDGEDLDLLTGDKKPKVVIPKDTLFTSFDYICQNFSECIQVVQRLPFRVIGKSLWLYKSLGAIETEVVGPSTLVEHEQLIDILMGHGCDTIIIDGSLDRKSICRSGYISHIVLVVGASLGKLPEITRASQILSLYQKFPRIETSRYDYITFGNAEQVMSSPYKTIFSNETELSTYLCSESYTWCYFPGALTNHSYKKLKNTIINTKCDIIFEHPLNVNIDHESLSHLLSVKNIFSRISMPLGVVAINPHSSTGDHIDVKLLRDEIESIFVGIPVIDIRGCLQYASV